MLEIRNRLSDLCEPNQCAGIYPTLYRCLCSSVTLVAAIDPTNIINRIADKIEHTGGNLCGFGILKKICYLYVTID